MLLASHVATAANWLLFRPATGSAEAAAAAAPSRTPPLPPPPPPLLLLALALLLLLALALALALLLLLLLLLLPPSPPPLPPLAALTSCRPNKAARISQVTGSPDFELLQNLSIAAFECGHGRVRVQR